MRLISSVVEISDAPRGLTEIKIKDSNGHRIGFFQVSTGDLDDELTEALISWQTRHTHEGGSVSIKPVSF